MARLIDFDAKKTARPKRAAASTDTRIIGGIYLRVNISVNVALMRLCANGLTVVLVVSMLNFRSFSVQDCC